MKKSSRNKCVTIIALSIPLWLLGMYFIPKGFYSDFCCFCTASLGFIFIWFREQNRENENVRESFASVAKVFLLVLIGIVVFEGTFAYIAYIMGIEMNWLLVTVLVIVVLLPNVAAWIFWQPESPKAMEDCARLYLMSTEGGWQNRRFRKLLLTNFDDSETGIVYDNPYTWIGVIKEMWFLCLSGNNDQLLKKAEEIVISANLSRECLEVLEYKISDEEDLSDWISPIIKEKLRLLQ